MLQASRRCVCRLTTSSGHLFLLRTRDLSRNLGLRCGGLITAARLARFGRLECALVLLHADGGALERAHALEAPAAEHGVVLVPTRSRSRQHALALRWTAERQHGGEQSRWRDREHAR